MPIDDLAVLLDGVDRIRRWPGPFIGNGGVKRGKVDRSDRLCAENEWIEPDTILVDLQFEGDLTDAVARLGAVRVEIAVDAILVELGPLLGRHLALAHSCHGASQAAAVRGDSGPHTLR